MQRFRSEACGWRGGGAWVQAPTLLRDCEQMASEELCRPRIRTRNSRNKQNARRTGTKKERKAGKMEFFLLALTALRLTG